MKNILNSKIVVSGASSHPYGNVNGAVVSPQITICGIDAKGTYGRITAEVWKCSKDGQSSAKLWGMALEFGGRFPSFEAISQNWEVLLAAKAKYFEVVDGQVVVSTTQGGAILFSDL